MAAGEDRAIGPDDLRRAVCSVADHFSTDTVYIIGSQALLVGRDDIARGLRFSREIDAYPANREEWEATSDGIEASEAINAMFGEGSDFHEAHGFFIDGVDEETAKLPPDWRDRAVTKIFEGPAGRRIKAVAPAPEDVVAAKMVRGEDKDLEFAARCLGEGLTTNRAVKTSLRKFLGGDQLEKCLARVDRASRHKRDPATAIGGLSDDTLAAYLRRK
jgi:hypothetical protein